MRILIRQSDMAKIEITKALLSEYYNHSCSDEEKKAVEAWLQADSLDDSLSIPANEKMEIKEELRESIRKKGNYKTGRAPKLFRKSLRVAAAACILIGAFLSGRVSANVRSIVSEKYSTYKERLYITGVKDVQGDLNLPGDNFRITFDGTLRLYNASRKVQTIQSGDSLFTLMPDRVYHLSGATNRAELMGGLQSEPRDIEESGQNENTGNFSIIRLDRQ